MPRYAYTDSDGVLVAQGFIPAPLAGLTEHAVVDNFDKTPFKWKWDGAVWNAYVKEAEFGTVAPSLVASVLNVVVANSDIPSMDGAFNIIGAFYDELGQYTFLLLTEQPDTNYFVQASGVTLREVDKGTDYFTVEALDANGVRFDPTSFGINVYRIGA